MCQSDEPRRDRRIARIDRDVARKGLVDLQSVNRNSLQAPQRGIAGTEIVEGDLDAVGRQAASAFGKALFETAQVLESHRSGLSGETGPIQLWPHNFDLAFEWFGTLAVPSVDDGDAREQPSQINFGLTPGDRSHSEAYFYSNPWPFQDSLIERELPNGARWFTEGWQGTLLPYAEIAGSKSGADKLAAYFRAVYDLASPLLTA